LDRPFFWNLSLTLVKGLENECCFIIAGFRVRTKGRLGSRLWIRILLEGHFLEFVFVKIATHINNQGHFLSRLD